MGTKGFARVVIGVGGVGVLVARDPGPPKIVARYCFADGSIDCSAGVLAWFDNLRLCRNGECALPNDVVSAG